MNLVRTQIVYLVFGKSERYYNQPKFVKSTTSKPSLDKGEIAVKVNVQIPMDLFEEFIPESTIEMGAGNTLYPTVVAEDVVGGD